MSVFASELPSDTTPRGAAEVAAAALLLEAEELAAEEEVAELDRSPTPLRCWDANAPEERALRLALDQNEVPYSAVDDPQRIALLAAVETADLSGHGLEGLGRLDELRGLRVLLLGRNSLSWGLEPVRTMDRLLKLDLSGNRHVSLRRPTPSRAEAGPCA